MIFYLNDFFYQMDEEHSIIENIIKKSYDKLNNIIDNWCDNFDNNLNEGKMRECRGNNIENFIKYVIELFNNIEGNNIYAIKGTDDKKELRIPGTNIKKYHQVDIHIYKNNKFIAIIECKAYLDSCYYVRACDDFKLFQKFGYPVKHTIFTLENSIDEDTKIFTDHLNDHICNDVFYILDGKRSSAKPIYDEKYKKMINHDNFVRFIDFIYSIAQG